MELSSSCCTGINIHIDLRRLSQGISVDSSRKSSHLYCMLWNTGELRSKWGGNGLHLVLISATPSYFAFLSWHQSSFHLVTVFLGTLWCSIKKIEAPYLSDSELWIALHPMQGNQASSPGEGYVSWDFSSCSRNLWCILELQRGMAIWNSSLFSEVRIPVYLWQTPQESNLGLKGWYSCYWRWCGRPSLPF